MQQSNKKYTNPARRKQFDEYIARQLAQRNIKTSIQHLESHACTPLQAVDFVAWAANRKYSHNDGSYYSLISGKIANQGGSELWNRD